jgi:hypothetical protein
MTEEWKPCVDFPHYEVSSLGRVRRSLIVRKAGADSNVARPWLSDSQAAPQRHDRQMLRAPSGRGSLLRSRC